MRINSKSNLEGIYETNLKKNTTVSEKKEKLEKSLNKDKVEISKTAGNYDQLRPIKEKIVNEVEKGTDPNRLRELKAQIENGTYFVSSQDIASSIMDINGRDGKGQNNE
jgi:flagellar biosynthesis anti-sigma factor FlgM